jgi:pyruvate-formate lyase-activating enzyme
MLSQAFAEPHARRLAAMLKEPDWRELADDGTLEAARRDMLTPPKTANVFSLPVSQLLAMNEEKVRGMIAAGERDEERLLAALGTWPARWPEHIPVRLSFLGINLSFRCDMQPRCVYCNQQPVPEKLGPKEWRTLLRSIAPADGEGTYVYLTGGEPMIFGGRLWGRYGVVRAATEAGAACNVNTNALALTPRAAVGFVRAGLGRVHISLDTHRAEVQDAIHGRDGRWQRVVRGLCNMQIAKAVLGASHPAIHVNCVLTRLNAPDFPGFVRFIADMKPLVEGGVSSDLDMHVIPVGGDRNRALRLTEEGFVRFFSETWDAANAAWAEYQAERGVPPDKRGTLQGHAPFMSPFHRVQQRGSLEEWAQQAAAGSPGELALTARCYVAPTQGFILPNGAQYWCGGHTVSRPKPVGSVLAHGVQDNIRRSLGQMASLPAECCRTCAGATQAINQAVEAQLRGKIAEWLNPEQAPPEPPAADEHAFE